MRVLPPLATIVGIALPTICLGGAPVEVQPGQQYPAGTRVQFSVAKASFVIPNDWLGGLAPDGNAFMMGSNTKPGLLLATADLATSVEKLKKELSGPVPLDVQTVLTPKGPATVEGKTIRQTFTSQYGEQVFAGFAEAKVFPSGIGVGFFAVGPKAQAAYYKKLVGQLSGSLREMKESEVAKASSGWVAKLKGRALTYYKTSGTYTTKRHMSLCADGTFLYKDDESYGSSMGGSNFSYVGAQGDSGRWKIAGSALQLVFDNGERSSYQLSNRNGSTFVDGEKWFVTNDPRCR